MCFGQGKVSIGGFPAGASGKNPPVNVRDVREAASVPGFNNPLQYSRLENPMNKGT